MMVRVRPVCIIVFCLFGDFALQLFVYEYASISWGGFVWANAPVDNSSFILYCWRFVVLA